MEAAAAFWAATMLGAVVVPIVHFYGRKEVGHIVAKAAPRVFVTAEQFGRMTYQPDLCADIPLVVLVGDVQRELAHDEVRFDAVLDAEPTVGHVAPPTRPRRR